MFVPEFTRARISCLAMASGAHLSAAYVMSFGSTTSSPNLGVERRNVATPSPSKRRMGGEPSPETANPGSQRLVQHRPGTRPARGAAATVDELTFEVPK